MTAPKLEQSQRVLMVEGYSDLLFYAETLEHLAANAGVFIKHFNGTGDLHLQIRAFLSPKELAKDEAIALIVDGDTNPSGIATSLATALGEITGQAVTQGTWTTGRPRIGLLVVPDASTEGEIETLVWRAWSADPAHAALRSCIETYVACAAGQGAVPRSPDKANISALLALKNDEDPRLGPGARSKVFDFTRPEFAPLLGFLRGFLP